jgi:hypothetical protein
MRPMSIVLAPSLTIIQSVTIKESDEGCYSQFLIISVTHHNKKKNSGKWHNRCIGNSAIGTNAGDTYV